MRFIVIGCGRMGAGLARELTHRGYTVVVVDPDPASFVRLGTHFSGHTIRGVGFDRGVLLEAEIRNADGLATVTNNDEVNAVTARVAKQFFRVPSVVARLYDPRKAEIYRRLGIQVIDQVAWGIERMMDLLCYSSLDPIVNLGGGELTLVAVDVETNMARRPLQEMLIPGEIQAVAVNREGKMFFPTTGMIMEEGDRIFLAVFDRSGSRLKEMLQKAGGR